MTRSPKPRSPQVRAATRRSLHLVAAHVLGRRRFEVSGRFGLRSSPGGFATPAFGEEPEVVRVAGPLLVREVGGVAAAVPLDGASLRRLAAFAAADLGTAFTPGDDSPDPGDPDAPLPVDPATSAEIAAWFDLGWRVLDEVLGAHPPGAAAATVQLWPEHFDAGTNLGLPSGERVNLGFSPGDGYEPGPYLYIGPQGEARRGDPGFWNAPFGAVLTASEVTATGDPATRCVEFLEEGIRQASST